MRAARVGRSVRIGPTAGGAAGAGSIRSAREEED